MLGFAGRDLASRAAPRSITTSVLGLYGFAAIVVAGAAYALLWERKGFILPDPSATVFLLVAVTCDALAYSALMRLQERATYSQCRGLQLYACEVQRHSLSRIEDLC